MLVGKVIVITDTKMKKAGPTCIVQGYDPTPQAGEPLMVTWAATKPPPGYESMGDVAYVSIRPGYTKRGPYPAVFNQEGDHFTWTEDVLGELMLIIVLPAGYLLKRVDDAEPLISVSRVIKGRMAVCWSVPSASNRVKFSFRLEKSQLAINDLRSHCSTLNKEADDRRKEENLQIARSITLVKEPDTMNAIPSEERSSILVRDKLLMFITYSIFILGALITLGGFVLILLGFSANTSLNIFGQSITTTNVGLVTLVVGIVMIVITFKGVFSVLQRDPSSENSRKRDKSSRRPK